MKRNSENKNVEIVYHDDLDEDKNVLWQKLRDAECKSDGKSIFKYQKYFAMHPLNEWGLTIYEREAMCQVGAMYYSGMVVKQNINKALFWLEKAAYIESYNYNEWDELPPSGFVSGPLPSACLYLSIIYSQGTYVPKNYEVAIDFLKRGKDGDCEYNNETEMKYKATCKKIFNLLNTDGVNTEEFFEKAFNNL